MYDASGDVVAAGHGVLERTDRQTGLHPGVYGVADDPVGEDVLDRAEVQLALAGLVLGDVRQPQFIRADGGEVPTDQIIVDWRTWLLALPAGLALAECAPPAVVSTDPPRSPIRHRLANLAGLVGQQPVSELRVIPVGVEERVGAIGLHEFAGGDRVRQPPIVGLAGELEYPARHRDSDAVSGELVHERVLPLPGRFAWDR